MIVNCNNCQEVFSEYLCDIPIEWRSEIVNVLCSAIEKDKIVNCSKINDCETVTYLSTFEKNRCEIKIKYTDERGVERTRSFNYCDIITSLLDEVDPKCITDQETWNGWTMSEKIQSIIDKDEECNCCTTTTTTTTTTSTTTTTTEVPCYCYSIENEKDYISNTTVAIDCDGIKQTIVIDPFSTTYFCATSIFYLDPDVILTTSFDLCTEDCTTTTTTTTSTTTTTTNIDCNCYTVTNPSLVIGSSIDIVYISCEDDSEEGFSLFAGEGRTFCARARDMNVPVPGIITGGDTCTEDCTSTTTTTTIAPTTTTTTTAVPTTTTTTTSTTTTTTLPTSDQIQWSLNGVIGARLKITNEFLIDVLNITSTSSSMSGTLSGLSGDYEVSACWNSGSGNIIQIRICDLSGTEVFFDSSITNLDPCETFTLTLPNIAAPYTIAVTAGNITPSIC